MKDLSVLVIRPGPTSRGLDCRCRCSREATAGRRGRRRAGGRSPARVRTVQFCALALDRQIILRPVTEHPCRRGARTPSPAQRCCACSRHRTSPDANSASTDRPRLLPSIADPGRLRWTCSSSSTPPPPRRAYHPTPAHVCGCRGEPGHLLAPPLLLAVSLARADQRINQYPILATSAHHQEMRRSCCCPDYRLKASFVG